MMNSLKTILLLIATILTGCIKTPDLLDRAYRITGIPFHQVRVNDGFWFPKMEIINRKVTIPASFAKCKENGRMDNFLIAGGKMSGPVKGKMPFDDTGVYNSVSLFDLTIPDTACFIPSFRKDLLGGVFLLEGNGRLERKTQPLRAIPYYSWNNRGINGMRVWFLRE
jgi:DUF1680 family protein